MYKRIMLKLSGEALSGEKGYGLDQESVRAVGEEVRKVTEAGVQLCVVIGGGNFWRGRTGTEIDRTKSDQIGMLATVMNCVYVAEIFRGMGMPAEVYSSFEVGPVTKLFKKEDAVADLEAGKIVFCAGGTGHPFFSTDMGTMLRANELGCEIVLMAKNVDGVYDKDPSKFADAVKFDSMTYQEILDRNLKVIDLTAAAMGRETGLPSKLFALKEPGSILRAVRGESVGTFVSNENNH